QVGGALGLPAHDAPVYAREELRLDGVIVGGQACHDDAAEDGRPVGLHLAAVPVACRPLRFFSQLAFVVERVEYRAESAPADGVDEIVPDDAPECGEEADLAGVQVVGAGYPRAEEVDSPRCEGVVEAVPVVEVVRLTDGRTAEDVEPGPPAKLLADFEVAQKSGHAAVLEVPGVVPVSEVHPRAALVAPPPCVGDRTAADRPWRVGLAPGPAPLGVSDGFVKAPEGTDRRFGSLRIVLRDQVDHPAEGASAVERRSRTLQYLDPLDLRNWQ